MRAFTTFAPEHWESHVKAFVESFLKHWPIKLTIYCQQKMLDDPRITWMTEPLVGLDEFREEALLRQNIMPKTYLYDAARFSWKAYAILHAIHKYIRMYRDDTLFWLDADVVTFKDVPESFLEELMDGVALTFLGRNTYTETGFIGFNRHSDLDKFWYRYGDMYRNRDIFKLDHWTDCHAFDAARYGVASNDIGNGRGVDHVWCSSPLAQYMDHKKGIRKDIGFSPEHPARWWEEQGHESLSTAS